MPSIPRRAANKSSSLTSSKLKKSESGIGSSCAGSPRSGTTGVGGGFALGAKLARPSAEVWLLYGDGSAAYSLAEFDTCVRHGLPVIAVIGNDAGWTQIAREQVEILGDDCATVLRHNDYHVVAEGYGGRGLELKRPEDVAGVLAEAKEIARAGEPVLINALLGKTDFRKGSISM